jgi:NTP pyrophosphatase (non-canonical NTP hydrolase)
MNTPIEEIHLQLVRKTCKESIVIAKEMNPASAHFVHMALGIGGEAGEIVDLIKKVAIYGKVLDPIKLIEEMGDLEWYLAGLRDSLGITREMVLVQNIAKLQRRYGDVYSDAAAINRADKDPLASAS